MRRSLEVIAEYAQEVAEKHADLPPVELICTSLLVGLGMAYADPVLARAVSEAAEELAPELASQGEQAAAELREKMELDA